MLGAEQTSIHHVWLSTTTKTKPNEKRGKKQFKETKQASNPDSAMVLMEKVHNMQKQLSNINGEMETLIEFKGNARNQNQCKRNGASL